MKKGINPPRKRPIIDGVCLTLATCFFTSIAPSHWVAHWSLKSGSQILSRKKWTGAGFIGSIWGALTYIFLPWEYANSVVCLLLGVAISIMISSRAEKIYGTHDDSRIIIDEWIGAWIAFQGLNQTLSFSFILAFFFFRLLDSFKGPWGQALQRFPGGFGITLDDVGAGILANILVRFILPLIPFN